MIDRREFLTAATGAVAATALTRVGLGGQPELSKNAAAYRLRYAPHLGMFKHHAGDDPVDQLKFMADEGFTAFEDNGMQGRDAALQEKMGRAMADLGITMGVFVVSMGTAWKPSFVTQDTGVREEFLADCRKAVETAKRVNAKWMTVVLGTLDHRADLGFQTSNAIELLRRGCEIFEPHGLIMVMEPLNPRDHPAMFLSKIPQAHMICKAVNSPSCKILFDLYHQQITEGNLIPNLDRSWDEVAYLQIGDNPGRAEPGTGEINYRNIFKYVHGKGFKGVLGMEHGNSRPGKEGERGVIEAYRAADNF